MLTREIILQFLGANKEKFKKNYDISRIGLFGSFASGNAAGESDVDIFGFF